MAQEWRVAPEVVDAIVSGKHGDPFAVLGLHEAERAGVKISDQTWQLALQYWLSRTTRKGDGAYSYEANLPETGSMTSAAVASLRPRSSYPVARKPPHPSSVLSKLLPLSTIRSSLPPAAMRLSGHWRAAVRHCRTRGS